MYDSFSEYGQPWSKLLTPVSNAMPGLLTQSASQQLADFVTEMEDDDATNSANSSVSPVPIPGYHFPHFHLDVGPCPPFNTGYITPNAIQYHLPNSTPLIYPFSQFNDQLPIDVYDTIRPQDYFPSTFALNTYQSARSEVTNTGPFSSTPYTTSSFITSSQSSTPEHDDSDHYSIEGGNGESPTVHLPDISPLNPSNNRFSDSSFLPSHESRSRSATLNSMSSNPIKSPDLFLECLDSILDGKPEDCPYSINDSIRRLKKTFENVGVVYEEILEAEPLSWDIAEGVPSPTSSESSWNSDRPSSQSRYSYGNRKRGGRGGGSRGRGIGRPRGRGRGKKRYQSTSR